jgi:hypothetical protein
VALRLGAVTDGRKSFRTNVCLSSVGFWFRSGSGWRMDGARDEVMVMVMEGMEMEWVESHE